MFISTIFISVLVLCCIQCSYGTAIETHPNLNLLPDSCGDIDGKGYSEGKTANLYEFPWMALISYSTGRGNEFKCSGTIINSKYILTAAHCVLVSYNITGVRVGEYDLLSKHDCQGEESYPVCKGDVQDIRVENIIPHQNYSITLVPRNDVALIRLLKPIDFTNKNALPICLPVAQELRDTPLAGTSGIVAGWGLTKDNLDPNVLLKTKISITTNNECKSLIYDSESGHVTERVLKEICADQNRKGACVGDGGSPLMVQGAYKGVNRYIQYGVLSRGPKKCVSLPDIYTDVTKYMEWILNTIKE